METYSKQTLNVLDLFCGAGGLSLGFEDSGYEVVAGVDKYDEALRTWDKNHSGEPKNYDISEVAPEEVINDIDSDIDVVIGGPPCKDFSNANQVVDLGRNNLVILFSKFVSKIQPSAFVIENVRQLTTKYSDVLDDVYQNLSTNYSISHRLLDSADYGVPQHRIRAFVIGIKEDDMLLDQPMFPKPTHGPDSHTDKNIITSGEALSDTNNPDNKSKYEIKSKHSGLIDDIPPGMNYSFYTEKMGHPEPKFEWRSKFSDYLYKADPEKPIKTLKAKPGASSGPFHWNNRKFTELELKRLQSFPDSFEFSTDSYSHIMRMIGNSVPPIQAFSIAESLKMQINKNYDLIPEDEDLNFYSRKRTESSEYKNKAEERINEIYEAD